MSESSAKIGMKINPNKTQLLCISGSGSPSVSAYMRLRNTKVESGQELKICGYKFGSKPTVTNQVDSIIAKFNRRSWVIRNLKRSGFSDADLVTCYCSLIRPVFDFTAVAYHSLLSLDQTKQLEGLQKRILRIITGTKGNYTKKLEDFGLNSLSDRRLSLIDNFISKSLKNPRFSTKWFQAKQIQHASRGSLH